MDRPEKVTLPAHVAIIMDGNGRWARVRDLPRVEGHAEGIESVREIVTVSRELNIPYLTLYAFSKENWARPREEVERLMELLEIYLEKERSLMVEKGIRLNIIGEVADFSPGLRRKITKAMKETAVNDGLFLNLALSYGGRQEVVRAVRAVAKDFRDGTVKTINEKSFGNYLYTRGMPDPDFLIRTGGEMRVSNFLLWQIAYAEIYFTQTFWPDFRKEQYLEALEEFRQRDRRFGTVKEA